MHGVLILTLGLAMTAEVPKGDAYRVRRATAPGKALLAGAPEAWSRAERVSWGPDVYATRFGAVWSDDGLYLRFDAFDPSPWHTMTERDDRLWEEEVVEIFIDPDGDGRNYAEIEINPINVVCDLVIFQGAPNVRSDIGWDFEGIQTEVMPLRDEDGTTLGWTATAILPWQGFAKLPEAEGVHLPPRAGDGWRFNAFRIKRPGGPQDPERDVVYAPWSPITGKSFHEPAVFSELKFVSE